MKRTWLLGGALGALTLMSGLTAHAELPSLGHLVYNKTGGTVVLDDTAWSAADPRLATTSSAVTGTLQSAQSWANSNGSMVAKIQQIAGDASQTALGYYNAGNTSTYTTLFGNGTVDGTIGTIPSTVDPFGLAIKDGNTFWYSENTLNTPNDGAHPQHAEFYLDANGSYYFGFEDRANGDYDYNDYVGKLTLNSPIPEPAFYQMGVFVMGGGLMALRARRRSKK